MDVFDKRDKLLDLQIDMLEGKIDKKVEILTLVHFENSCTNSGLSGFAQDLELYDLTIVDSFANEEKFEVVKKMIKTLESFIEKYGINFLDELDDEEYNELSQFDDLFHEVNDLYTERLYEKIR